MEEEQAKVQEEVSEERFVMGKWHEFDVYQCRFCPFDTMDPKEAERHYDERHAPHAPAATSGLVLVADKAGRVVSEPAPAPDEVMGLVQAAAVEELSKDVKALLRKSRKGKA